MLSNPRKHTNSLVEDEYDLPPAKKVKEADVSETSSESTADEARLAKMAQAYKTLLEVIAFHDFIFFFFIIAI